MQEKSDSYTPHMQTIVAATGRLSKFLQDVSRFLAELGAGIIGFGAVVLTISTTSGDGFIPSMRIGIWLIIGSWFVAGSLLWLCFHTLGGLYLAEEQLADAAMLASTKQANDEHADEPSLNRDIDERYQKGRELFEQCRRQLLNAGPALFLVAAVLALLGIVSWLGPFIRAE